MLGPIAVSRAADRRTGLLPVPGCDWRRQYRLLAIRTLALLTGFRGAKRGANDHRIRATPGHMQPSAPRPNGTSGHMQHRAGTFRKCLLSSRSRVRVAVGAQVRGLEDLVRYARQCPQIMRTEKSGDEAVAYDPFAGGVVDDESLGRGFEAALLFWEALGAVSEQRWLTRLGWWGLPRALARAWNGDFDRAAWADPPSSATRKAADRDGRRARPSSASANRRSPPERPAAATLTAARDPAAIVACGQPLVLRRPGPAWPAAAVAAGPRGAPCPRAAGHWAGLFRSGRGARTASSAVCSRRNTPAG